MREQSYTTTLIILTGEDVLDALRAKYPHIPKGALISDIPNAKPDGDWLQVRWQNVLANPPTKQAEIKLPTVAGDPIRLRKLKWQYSTETGRWTKRLCRYTPVGARKENAIKACVRSKDGGFIWSVEEYCGDRNIIRTLAGNSVAIRMEYSAKGAATKAGERIVKAMGG